MMNRTLENLAQKRKEKEADFTASLEQLKTRIEAFKESLNPQKHNQLISRLGEISTSISQIPEEKRKSSLSRRAKASSEESSHSLFVQQILEVLKDMQHKFEESSKQSGEIYNSLTDLIRKSAALSME